MDANEAFESTLNKVLTCLDLVLRVALGICRIQIPTGTMTQTMIGREMRTIGMFGSMRLACTISVSVIDDTDTVV